MSKKISIALAARWQKIPQEIRSKKMRALALHRHRNISPAKRIAHAKVMAHKRHAKIH